MRSHRDLSLLSGLRGKAHRGEFTDYANRNSVEFIPVPA